MKIIRRAAAVCAALIISTGAVSAATAGERNIVSFGDSVLSDPRLGDYLDYRLSARSSGSSGSSAGSSVPGSSILGLDCPSGLNFAKRLGAKLGMPVSDFSCSGAVSVSNGPNISTQIDAAISRGQLTPDTQRVIFATGFNDTYNNAALPDAELRARYVGFNVHQINRIREAAPNARIQIVGYPTIGTGDTYCLFHFGPKPADATVIPQMRRHENVAQWMQVDLAAATGVEFVDLKPLTADNGMCADADKRMWAGLVDFSAGEGNLPLHMNARGHEHVATILAGR